MSDLLSALCVALEDHVDEETLRTIYYDALETVDFYDGYFIHDLDSISDFFREVYEEYREEKNIE